MLEIKQVEEFWWVGPHIFDSKLEAERFVMKKRLRIIFRSVPGGYAQLRPMEDINPDIA